MRLGLTITAQPWVHAYVFFKHKDEAKGPVLASRCLQLAKRIAVTTHTLCSLC